MAKSIYPTYAVTPDNLIPICRDCNYNKGQININSLMSVPMHPYFDEIDNEIWLNADIVEKYDGIVANYDIVSVLENKNKELFDRLNQHIELYKLKKAYGIQASSEIANSRIIWKEQYRHGKKLLIKYLTDCLRSCEAVQKNTWKTALLRGLIKYVETVDDICL